MNILPKKRWHVRTKENIARVRKDEAEAAEKEKQEQSRIENADREARLNILKLKSKEKLQNSGVETPITTSAECKDHINFFSDFEHTANLSNKEHDKEVKDKKEEYEKQIGYLTYLGQDTNEALGKKNWYEVDPKSRLSKPQDIKETYNKLILKDKDGKPKVTEPDEKDGEVSWKAKQRLDPLNSFRKFCDKPIASKAIANTTNILPKKHKKDKQGKMEDKLKKLQSLREARLKRERQEKEKTKMFLSGLNGCPKESPKDVAPKIQPKYNSQFNPELARQNYR